MDYHSDKIIDISVENFTEQKVIGIDDLIENHTCEILAQAVIFKMLNNKNLKEDDSNSYGYYEEYANEISETILLHCKDQIEEKIGLDLVPRCSYVRVHKNGAELKNRLDEEDNEISVLITLSYKPKLEGYDPEDIMFDPFEFSCPWPFYMNTARGEKNVKIPIGHGVIYKGNEIEHWREPLMESDDFFVVEVSLHYVVADGRFSKEFKYDGRSAIGIKK